jgi:hypothetical protein
MVLMINQKLNAQDYKEVEYNIELPEIKDQYFEHGDLWNCRESMNYTVTYYTVNELYCYFRMNLISWLRRDSFRKYK